MKSTSFDAIVLVSVLTIVSGLIVSVFLGTVDISREAVPPIARVEEPPMILAPTSTEALPPEPLLAENFFDPSVVKTGDVVAGWILKRLRPVFGTVATSTSLQNVHAEFEGTATVTGTYAYARNTSSGFREILIHIKDTNEAKKLPCVREDCAWAEFKLRDVGTIAPQFGGTFGTGTATISIKNYIVNQAPTEVSNVAELVRVISFTPAP